MFFGIGSLPFWLCGLPILVGLFFIACANPEKYIYPHVIKHEERKRNSSPSPYNSGEGIMIVCVLACAFILIYIMKLWW